MRGRTGHADRDANRDDTHRKADRGGNIPRQAIFQISRRRPVRLGIEEDRKLVPSQAGDEVARAGRQTQPICDFDKNKITGGMPELIVNCLETIEIQIKNHELVRRCCLPMAGEIQMLMEERAIGQSGEPVVTCPMRGVLDCEQPIENEAMEIQGRLNEYRDEADKEDTREVYGEF